MNYITENFNYKVTLIGGRKLGVEGHKGVIAYSPNEIVVRVKKEKLQIEGNNLTIIEINEEELLVEGEIISFGVVKK